MPRNLRFLSPAFACALLFASSSYAQNASVEYYEDLAKAGGQADAASFACGKTDLAAAKAHRSKLQQSFATKGLSPSTFNRVYDAAFDDVIAQAKANPAAMKAGCDRIAKTGAGSK